MLSKAKRAWPAKGVSVNWRRFSSALSNKPALRKSSARACRARSQAQEDTALIAATPGTAAYQTAATNLAQAASTGRTA